MSSSPIVNRIRVIPRETDFLENNVGSRGEIYFDNDNDSLRLYNKEIKGGFLLVNEKKLADALDGLSTGSSISTVFDLTDVDSNSVTLDADNGQGKILSWDQTANAFIPIDLSIPSGGASVTIDDNVPTESTAGDLWWNSNEGVLKIYYDDGTSQQWIDATPRGGGFSGSYNDLIDKPILFSGSYNDLTDIPLSNSFSGSYNDLTDKPTLFSGSYNDLTDKPTLFSGSYNDLTDKPNFATVATSGNFADLSNTPNVTGKAIAMSIVFG
jgi:hypothetical protein